MKRFTMSLAAMVMASCGPAWAEGSGASQKTESTIAVLGRGWVERTPDYASITLKAVGEGATQMEALKGLAAARDRIEGGLRRLTGAKAVGFDTGEIKVQAVRSTECEAGDSYSPKPQLSTGPCAPLGFIAELEIEAQIRPADRVGDAASLAVQLGAREVDLAESGLDDPKALTEAATRAAFEDARAQAQLLATAAGAKLGPIIRINRGVESELYDTAVLREPMAVKAQALSDSAPMAPEVALALTPSPVAEGTWVSVVFRLTR